jgi:hypothetical protein
LCKPNISNRNIAFGCVPTIDGAFRLPASRNLLFTPEST